MNLNTRYMGLTLKNPLVASASPLSQRLETIRQLEDCGASAVVMFSLFEEQIRHDAGAFVVNFLHSASGHPNLASKEA